LSNARDVLHAMFLRDIPESMSDHVLGPTELPDASRVSTDGPIVRFAL
jgi:hypothetical protein